MQRIISSASTQANRGSGRDTWRRSLGKALALAAAAGMAIVPAAAEEGMPAPTGACAAIIDAKAVGIHPENIAWEPLPVPKVNGVPVFDAGDSRVALLDGEEGSGGMMVRIIDYKIPMTGKPHMHASAERTYILSGSMGVVTGDGDEPVTYLEGSYVTIPANTRHYAVITGPVKVLTIQVGDYKALPVPAK